MLPRFLPAGRRGTFKKDKMKVIGKQHIETPKVSLKLPIWYLIVSSVIAYVLIITGTLSLEHKQVLWGKVEGSWLSLGCFLCGLGILAGNFFFARAIFRILQQSEKDLIRQYAAYQEKVAAAVKKRQREQRKFDESSMRNAIEMFRISGKM
ncbi:hypothetical protein WJU16_08030 [Chitinophaga pollutisoli]|uniref:DUF4133 domain-containing protein n=1 Tax=Chitinophaga pollutisoli TaxID=3133966 RepID=A0ABZ2YTA1_9BACT